MANNKKLKAFARYDGQNNIVPGSLIVREDKPTGGGTFIEVAPVNLCCSSFQTNTYNCCIAIQCIADIEGLYGFTLQTINNSGSNLTGTVHWSSVDSESFSLPADSNDYDFSHFFNDLLVHTVYLCLNNPSQLRDFEIGFGPGQAVAITNLYQLNGIDEFDSDDMRLVSLDFTGLVSMTELSNSNSLTENINITGCINLDDVTLDTNNLTETSVDHVLVTLDNSGLPNGYVDLAGGTNAPPSAVGLAAAASLIGKSWNVFHN